MPNKARVELDVEHGQPTVTIKVPKGISLAEIGEIQRKLFTDPSALGPDFERFVPRHASCTSGIRVLIEEMVSNPSPVERDLERMFTDLKAEIRALSTRIGAMERGPKAAAERGPMAVAELAI